MRILQSFNGFSRQTLYCILIIRETEVLPFKAGWSLGSRILEPSSTQDPYLTEVNAKIPTELKKCATIILEEKPENRPEL